MVSPLTLTSLPPPPFLLPLPYGPCILYHSSFTFSLRPACSRVKFWLIKNYMSPQHKATLPELARKFGFDIEFVTYKWPHWLHKQVWVDKCGKRVEGHQSPALAAHTGVGKCGKRHQSPAIAALTHRLRDGSSTPPPVICSTGASLTLTPLLLLFLLPSSPPSRLPDPIPLTKSSAPPRPPPLKTEKQRIIWAYKILFLDVLFPLSVDRIIFVDSDQVVRTDLADLYHMDINVRGGGGSGH